MQPLPQVLVDNATDPLSPGADCTSPAAAPGPGASCCCCSYTNEASRRVADVRAGAAARIDWASTCLAGHGLCLLLEVEFDPIEGHGTNKAAGSGGGGAKDRGGGQGPGLERRSLLFDAGPSGELLRCNARRWGRGLDLGAVGAVVLSHWHVDHSGGLPAALDLIGAARGARAAGGAGAGGVHGGGGEAPAPQPRAPVRVVLDVHPRRPWCRGLKLQPGDEIIPFNQDPDPAQLAVDHAWLDVAPAAAPHTLLDGCFGVSGFIPRVTPYEEGNPAHASQWEEGGPWEDDPLIEDERALVVDLAGKGPVVFSACSHAGIVNVARWAEAALGRPPYASFGGLHLAPRDCLARVAPTARHLAAQRPPLSLLAAGHCTGWRAQAALQAALPGRCMPLSVGATFELSSE
ncbi:hypothetical protein MNEG_10995 [Monoraphidium neglectum]|uniref:Metallo-beta-lactamase domain-containing protein n=1 Tax=Monoraphidium neglectum TaxID=145388 RepID=A0A0D2LZY6_9CHLO|nr:hypothetical protein MNEG_10995 [Monoraphidium neglectum]KIY96964.1 hypothetical protein MNEG_10995 [Monoraphidium neglectum]|eukprot:XP_013895984.1 hypothetical protein MNEG_10995 [Monoraphidium neglectum]